MTAGAVLCGGRSTRMGTDKALVEVDGVAMVQRVAGALAAGGCDPVVLVGGDSVLLARFGWAVVPDRFPGEGPAGGVLTALEAVRALGSADRMVIASCDLPLLDAPTVAAVAAALDGAQAAVAVTDAWQLSLTAWRASVDEVVTTAWAEGARSLRELVVAVPHVEVPVAPAALRNVNTPQDLSDAEGTTR